MAGSERRGPGRAARRATAWAVSESEPESEPEPRCPGAATPAGSPPTAGPAGRPRRRRRTPGEAAARRQEREALEKRQRREAAAAWRLLRPERCLRLMEVCADPGLLKDLGSDAWVKVLSSLDCKYSFEPQAIPCSITWRRNMPNALSTPDGPVVKTEEEKEVLVLVEPEDFLKRLFSLTQSFVNAPSASQPDLNQVLPLAGLEGSSTKTYSLAVVGLDAYRRNQEQGRQQALSPGKQSPSSQPGPELSMTEEEILEALVVLQLWGNIEVLFLDTWQEFGQHVSVLTKAIAKRPYKRQLESQELPFCAAGAWASGVRVEKDGTGLWQVWKRQIQQFNRVSPATAAAIAEAYPSPSLLLQAYEECSTEDEKRLLLSDIPVKSDVSGKDRRVGPDLSRRIYLFMVSTDPDLVLDLST
ncbi:probable crossover junction endonuclease EME2 [Gymnogyps californianus]|uniref:probable crossover junction endonuclease EME2 n=1 Tax=Gymnogyps californianus TaxID=33616 RepID=UPI0021C9C091|nr:probable crossover junction endonuclease EME2 [Gymnogyps californianus]